MREHHPKTLIDKLEKRRLGYENAVLTLNSAGADYAERETARLWLASCHGKVAAQLAIKCNWIKEVKA